jgi:hypothetical protein
MVSRRAQMKRAQNVVSSEIAELRAKFTPHGLPEDVLVRAFDGYSGADLSWLQLRSKAQELKRYLEAQVSHCTIRTAFRRPLGQRPPATSLSVLRLMDAPSEKNRPFLAPTPIPLPSGRRRHGF